MAIAMRLLEFVDRRGHTTVFNAVSIVYELSAKMDNTTLLHLHARLRYLLDELEQIERLRGPSQHRDVDEYIRTLAEYWAQLHVFAHMNCVGRLLRHRRLWQTVAITHQALDQLILRVGLVDRKGEWRATYEHDKEVHRQRLEAIVQCCADLMSDLHSVSDQEDALVLLRSHVDKPSQDRSQLPPSTQTALRAAFSMLAGRTRISVQPTPPWFVDEMDLDFEEYTCTRGSTTTTHRGTLQQHTRVVVKLLSPWRNRLTQQERVGFKNELDRWFELRHPHTIRLLGASHLSRRPLVVVEAIRWNMIEYLEHSLANRQAIWRLLFEAAQGIAYLHSHGIVHGSIRMSNILVTSNGKALVTGFGSYLKATQDGRETRRRKADPAVSTWRWAAPESSLLKPKVASDIYSLGMTILEACTGEAPFAEVKDEQEVMTRIKCGQQPRRPSGMPDRVWDLIKRMTTINYRDRILLADVIANLKDLQVEENIKRPRFESS